MLETLLVGIALFASTNLDDIFLVMALFADPRLDPRAVVIGQYAGIAALVVVSAVAAACALAVPHEWIALLGIAPLGLGIHRLATAWRSRNARSTGRDVSEEEVAVPATGSFVAQAASLAAVTAANGGDNLGVYIPAFARDLGTIPLYAVVFFAMTAVWCVVGRALVTHRLLAASMRRASAGLLPWVLIGLGLWILKDAEGLFGFAATL